MSWVNTHKIPFESRLGDQYEVRIYEDLSTAPTPVVLVGGEQPFVTQEDDESDIFKAMRTQTGYLRLIDTTGSLLETLIPSNNTEKLVRVYHIDTSSTPNVEDLLWQGFMQAEAYTQSWNNEVKVIEFPVKSLLGALSDVSIDASYATLNKNFAWYIVQAFTALDVEPLGLNVISNLDDIDADMLRVDIDTALFFTEDEEQNEGTTNKVLVGATYAEILEAIAKLYGVCFRMEDGYLYLGMYDNGAGKIGMMKLTWAELSTTASGTSAGASITGVPEVDLLTSSEFSGTDNVAGFVQGGKEAIVRLAIADKDDDIIELPMTDEDTSTVYEIVRHDAGHEGEQVIHNGQVFVQPHAPRTNSIELFKFYEYQTTGSSFTLVGNSVYDNNTQNCCLRNSVIFRPLFNAWGSSSDHIHTGSFPCRWYYKKDADSQPQLKGGLFLNQINLRDTSITPNYCYSIESALSQNLRDGYLHISMKCLNFMRGILAADKDLLYFGGFTSIWGNNKTTKLWCILTIGNYEWTGSAWQVHSGNYNTFEIVFEGENIKSNKTTDMSVDETDGWFIPIPASGMSGKVKLFITNVTKCVEYNDQSQVIATYDNHSKILTDLSIDFLETIDPMASRRTSNTYRRNILQSGFSEDKTIELTVGTNNNNVPSHCFIRHGDALIDALTYYYDSSTTAEERPEKNLLSRMVSQFGEVRRAFTGVLKSKFNALATYKKYDMRYTYLGRKFFAVVKSKDWREDMEEVKFVEVSS